MLRKSLLAVFTLAICVGISLSDEIRAVITKIDGNNVTFATLEGKGKDTKKSETTKTLPAASDVKVSKGGKKGTEPTPIEGGLKALKVDPEKGLRATLTTDNGKITAITVFGGKKGKKHQ
jgi:hypothetical protein